MQDIFIRGAAGTVQDQFRGRPRDSDGIGHGSMMIRYYDMPGIRGGSRSIAQSLNCQMVCYFRSPFGVLRAGSARDASGMCLRSAETRHAKQGGNVRFSDHATCDMRRATCDVPNPACPGNTPNKYLPEREPQQVPCLAF